MERGGFGPLVALMVNGDHTYVWLSRERKGGPVNFRLTHASDAKPALDGAAIARERESRGIKQGSEIRPQARLTHGVVHAIKVKHGIDALNVKPDQEAKFWRILQTEYPRLLTTNKKVYRQRQKIRFSPGTLELAK